MAAHSLTQLLNAHHDKLNQHTAELQKIEADIEELRAAVTGLEAKLSLSTTDESSGLRAGLRDWISSIKDLM